MSLRNIRPGIWITFRCHRCNELKFVCSGDHYVTIEDAWTAARERGWTSVADPAGTILCRQCSKARVS